MLFVIFFFIVQRCQYKICMCSGIYRKCIRIIGRFVLIGDLTILLSIEILSVWRSYFQFFFISIWWTTASMILMWWWIINEDTYIGRLYSFIKRLIYDRRRHMAKLETFYCNHDPKLQTQQQVNISFSALLSAFLGQIRWFVFSREKINSALFHIGVKHSQSWGRITIWLEKKR